MRSSRRDIRRLSRPGPARLGRDGRGAGKLREHARRQSWVGFGPRWRQLQCINEDHVRGDIWRGARAGLLDEAGRIIKQVTDWVWLAAGVSTGNPFIDEAGRLASR
jgi:hypothetical protein